MKNKYKINGDETIIYIKSKGEIKEVLIDTKDFDLVNCFKGTWGLSNYGYCRTIVKTKTILMHRVITKISSSKVYIDHINHNKLDNRKSNLRETTSSENQQNRTGAQVNSKSGIRGVSWNKNMNKWRAAIKIDGITIHIGYFTDLDLADKAVKEARMKYHTHSNN